MAVLDKILDISQKAAEYAGWKPKILITRQELRRVGLLYMGLSKIMIEAIQDPLGHKHKYLGNIEMFRFQDTLVILCELRLNRKPHLFWQGALDLKNGRLTEVPVGKRLIIVHKGKSIK